MDITQVEFSGQAALLAEAIPEGSQHQLNVLGLRIVPLHAQTFQCTSSCSCMLVLIMLQLILMLEHVHEHMLEKRRIWSTVSCAFSCPRA